MATWSAEQKPTGDLVPREFSGFTHVREVKVSAPA